MKLWIPIDQQASIAAGHEAPSSGQTLEFPVEKIPADIRPVIAELWIPHRGAIKGAPPMVHPVTDDRIVQWMETIVAQYLLDKL